MYFRCVSICLFPNESPNVKSDMCTCFPMVKYIIIEPGLAIFNYVVCVTNKGSYQLAHMRSLARAFSASRLNILTKLSMEFLSFKRGCTGSSESILVKIPHCWNSHVVVDTCIRKAFLKCKVKNSIIQSTF